MAQFAAELCRAPVAIETDAANAQHYEVPAEFFVRALGPHLKYSACLWDRARTLAEAEADMLALTCARADLSDGQDVLELGCGWGSLTLWMAERYPASRVTGVSNSASQRAFILARAAERGLGNVDVITADMRTFVAPGTYDRVVSVEMFEHLRNYHEVLRRIAQWLRPDGRLFVHVFCHRRFAYPFEVDGDGDWMARHFFTGGLMPSADLLPRFDDHLVVEDSFLLDGTHYARTAEAWLANTDRHTAELRRVLDTATGGDGARAVRRWRLFFMACAELFGHAGGSEWPVAHYRFRHAESRR